MGDEPSREIRVHMDMLAYTREGLRTREDLELTVGRNNRIVIERPRRRAPIGLGFRGFPRDLAYPLPGTLGVFWAFAGPGTPFTHHTEASHVADLTTFQVFGHCSEAADEHHNKVLSDRRAVVGVALLSGDSDALRAVADEEGWGLREHQGMLRTLGCDPGPIDGDPGARTEFAIGTFQERFNRGVYHRRPGARARGADLEVDGSLDDDDVEALFASFVAAHGAHQPADALHATHPANGCSEFNRASTEIQPNNRRLTVIGYAEAPTNHEHAPCTVGDEGPCAIVDEDRQRCMWYREHLNEPEDASAAFYDPRWLWLGGDRYLLSALTTVDAKDTIEFQVFASDGRVRGPLAATPAWLANHESKVLEGVIRRGVAQVVWKSGHKPTADDGRPAFDGVPTFRVGHAGSPAHTYASYPETRTLRILVSCQDASALSDRNETYHLWTTDGAYEQMSPMAEAVVVTPHRVAVEFRDVPLDSRACLAFGIHGRKLWNLFENVEVESLLDNVSVGSRSSDVPVEQAPPEGSEPDLDDGDDDLDD